MTHARNECILRARSRVRRDILPILLHRASTADLVTVAKTDDWPDHWSVQLNGVEVMAFTSSDARARAEAEAATLDRRLPGGGTKRREDAPKQHNATAAPTSTEA
jgi:hypothetical protein